MSPTLLFLLFMVPGTLFLGAYDVAVKKTLKSGIGEGTLLGFTFTVSAVLFLILAAIKGLPTLGAKFWPSLAVTATLNTFAQLAWYRAFKREDASLVSPLRLLTPPFVILTGFLILGETVSLWGAIGILTTIAGLWLLVSGEAKQTNLRLRDIIRRPGVLYGLGGALSFAVSFPFDKQAIANSNTLFFAGIVYGIIGIANLVIAKWITKENLKIPKEARRGLALNIGVFMIGTFLAFEALRYSLAAYAASVKRLWSFWAVLLSGKLLHEKNIGRKLFASAIMLAGVLITVLA